jgi:integrase
MRDGAYSDTRGDHDGRRTSSAKMVKTSTPGIYKKGSRYVVTFYDRAGKQRKRSARTLAEARTLKSALSADVARGEYLAESKTTFADYAATWISTYAGRTARGIRPGTLRDYRRSLGLDAEGKPTGGGAVAYFGHMQLASIRAHDVKGYAAQLAAKGQARNTIRLALAPVKAMLATAFEESVIRSNPSAGLRLGRVVGSAPVKVTHALTEEEVVRVLAEIPAADRPLIEFLAQTGVRISEALPLTKADVDFGRRRVRIVKRLYEGGLDAPKSKHGVREVSLDPAMAQRLWTRLATAPDEALLFPAEHGGYVSRSRLYTRVRAAGKRAGIEWTVGLHTFRHSAASIMWRRNVNEEQIRRVLGHHSWEFTSATYVHLGDDDVPDGSILGDLVSSAEGKVRASRPTETGRDDLALIEAESA